MMNLQRLNILLGIHNELCQAASLKETTRPHSIQSRLERVQTLIMEECDTKAKTKTQPTTLLNIEDEISF